MSYINLLLRLIIERAHRAQLPHCMQPCALHSISIDYHTHQIFLTTGASITSSLTATNILLQQITTPNSPNLHILVPEHHLRRVQTPSTTSNTSLLFDFTEKFAGICVPYFCDVFAVGC